jgi:hypothetical protein
MPQFYRFASADERKDIALRVNPSAAQVFFVYAETVDPYDELDLGPEWSCVGREYFAFDPSDGVAVLLDDLPVSTQRLLEAKWSAATLGVFSARPEWSEADDEVWPDCFNSPVDPEDP